MIITVIVYIVVISLFYSLRAEPHGIHEAPWQDTNKVLHMVHMGAHDAALDNVYAFYVDIDQDCMTDRVIMRANSSPHGPHVIFDDSYEKFLVQYGRYWAVDEKKCKGD
jgi:hypothetical protein